MTKVSQTETMRASHFRFAYMSPLRTARQKQGLTIYQVAKKAGVRPPTVSRIERGYQTTARTAEALAKAVGISEEKVLYPDRFKGNRRKRKTA